MSTAGAAGGAVTVGRVLRCSATGARADLAATYTWRTWTGGWLLRVVTQVTFFGLLGRLLDSPAALRWLVVGNAVAVAAVEGLMVVASSAWERALGTLPLLVAAPGGLFAVFVGRSAQWLATGTASASISFFVAAGLFGVPLPLPAVLAVVPLVAVVGVASYCLGLALAAAVLRAVELRNVVVNTTYLVLMALTGVEVPVGYWPGWVRVAAQVLPVTHGLAAVRDLLAGAGAGRVAADAALELAVGAGWLAAAAVAFRRLAESGRRDGSIEFTA